MENNTTTTDRTIRSYRWLRRLGRVLLGMLVFVVALVLFIRSSWGQDIIVKQAVSYVEGKTGTVVRVDKAFVGFDGSIVVHGLYMEDKKGDTLVYSRQLEASIALLPIIRSNTFSLQSATWDGLTARIHRDNVKDGFNYQFLIDAFVVNDTTTTSQPATFNLGTADLTNFDVRFTDKVEHTDALVRFDVFHVTMNGLDLDKMIVDVDQARLKNATLNLDMAAANSADNAVGTTAKFFKEPKETCETGATPLPKISFGNLRLDNVQGMYKSAAAGIAVDANLPYLETAIAQANLRTSSFEIPFFKLKDARVLVNIQAAQEPAAVTRAAAATSFTWPDLVVQAQDVNLSNNFISYRVNGAVLQDGVFNSNAIAVNNLYLQSSLINYQQKKAAIHVEKLRFAEASGLGLKRLDFKLAVSDEQLAITDLNTQVNKNKLQGNIMLGYKSLNAFINAPDQSSINASIPRYELYLEELYRFRPELRENEYLRTLARKPVTGSLKATGSIDKLNIPNFVMNWGRETAIVASGTLTNPTQVDTLTYNFPNLKVRSTRSDILKFIDEKDLGITLPQRMSINADLAGSTTAITTNATLTTTNGMVTLDGSFKNGEQIAFNGVATAQNVQLSKILQNPSLGDLSVNMNLQGSGNELSNLNAKIDATINEFAYNGYPIKNLPVQSSFTNGNGSINSAYRDDNLDARFVSDINLGDDSNSATATLEIAGIDLNAFKITSNKVRAAGIINATFTGSTTNFKVHSSIKKGIAVYGQQSYLLGDVRIDAVVQPDSTSVAIANKMLNLQLRSNTDPARLVTALQRHIDRYLTANVATDSLAPVVMSITGRIAPAPILQEVILPSLQAMDTLKIAVDFNEKQRKLDADINIPYLKYAGSELDSLRLRTRSDAQNLQFDLGFKGLQADPLNIQRTFFSGTIAQNVLNLDFTSYDGSEKLVHVGSTLSRKQTNDGSENLEFSVLVDDLILNKQPWRIPENNVASYGNGKLQFNDFKITNGDQSIALDSQHTDNQKDPIGIIFNNFELQGFISVLNAQKKLVTGTVNGEVIFEDVFEKMGFTAGVTITDLHALDVPLGTFQLDAQSDAGDTYLVDLGVQGELLELDLNGSYTASATNAAIAMDLIINKVALSGLADLVPTYFKDGKGTIAGNFNLTGTTAEPVYDGTLNFNNAGITPVILDTPFIIEKEEVTINNKGITLDRFTIKDLNNNTIVTDGFIGTENLLNPSFDLNLDATDFNVLNASKEDNELFYGKATFSASATMTGDLKLPVIVIDATVNKETDVFYVMPAAELDLVKNDGIVQFVNKQNPDAILTKTEESTATLTGLDVTATIKVGKEAFVNVIVDPGTGDNLRVSGDADLRFNLYPNGRMTLAGRYEVHEGHYELSLYEIVSRKFLIASGSSVSWSGDPFDAKLDVSAIYEIKTSASALMAAQTSGSDTRTKDRFRQVLPFLVYLNIDGELLKPEISFRLDMPEDEQGAIGGQVYGRLQQLNTQNQELNKQVFSLLVLNKFFPTSGSDGSSGGTAAIARNNINRALSDQLNQYGDKLLGNTGVDLNFGLNSFTDYQGERTQERTQLDVTASKKLLDDRLIVSVGSEVDLQGSNARSEQTAPVIGNVSLEYLLTKTGRWRLKGFRRNQFDNVVDGQLVVSGISLIFTREFNEFSTLFKKTVEEEAAKERREQQQNARKDEEEQATKQEK